MKNKVFKIYLITLVVLLNATELYAQTFGSTFSVVSEVGSDLNADGVEFITVGASHGWTTQFWNSDDFNPDTDDSVQIINTFQAEIVNFNNVTMVESRQPVDVRDYYISSLTPAVPNQTGALDNFLFNYSYFNPDHSVLFDFEPLTTSGESASELQNFDNDFQLDASGSQSIPFSVFQTNGINSPGIYSVNVLILDRGTELERTAFAPGATNPAYAIKADSFQFEVTGIPESGTIVMMLVALGTCVGFTVFRNRNTR